MDNHPEKFYIRLAGKLDSSPVAFDRRIIGQMLKSHPERHQELLPENGNSDWGSPASFGFTSSPEPVGDTHPSWTPAITLPATASVSPTVPAFPRIITPAELLKIIHGDGANHDHPLEFADSLSIPEALGEVSMGLPFATPPTAQPNETDALTENMPPQLGFYEALEQLEHMGLDDIVQALVRFDDSTGEALAKAEDELHFLKSKIRRKTRGKVDTTPLACDTLGTLVSESSPPSLVEGLLYDGELSMIYGPSGIGKTFLILELAASIASGRPFLGTMAVMAGPVVYFALEGGPGIINRCKVLEQEGRLSQTDQFVICRKSVNLLDDEIRIEQMVKGLAGSFGLPVRLVVIDTFSRATAGLNENDGASMSEVIEAVDRLRARTGAHVCLVHHTGKAEAKGSRGHSSILGSIDTSIEIKALRNGIFGLVVKKQKNAGKAATASFRLREVQITGMPEEKPASSCVVDLVGHDSTDNLSGGAKVTPGSEGSRPPISTGSSKRAVADHKSQQHPVGRSSTKKDSVELLLRLLPQPSTTAWLEKAESELKMSARTFYRHKLKLKALVISNPDGTVRRAE